MKTLEISTRIFKNNFPEKVLPEVGLEAEGPSVGRGLQGLSQTSTEADVPAAGTYSPAPRCTGSEPSPSTPALCPRTGGERR